MNWLCFFPGTRQFPLLVHQLACCLNKKNWTSRFGKAVRFLLMGGYYSGVLLSVITRKVQIDEKVQLGRNLCLPRRGVVIIGADRIGDNCIIGENVTIGWGFGSGREADRPVLGKNITIEDNSLIYGKIRVGDGTLIREGTILSKSVPDHCIVQGNPGRVVKRDYRISEC